MSIADVRNAVHEAATSAVEGSEDAEGTETTEATTTTTPDSGASPEGQSATGSETTEASEAPEGTDSPDSYFGYKFPPDLTPEQRAEIFSELKKRDDQIGKLLRGRETPETPVEEPEVEPPVELKDEEILQMFGLDPENPFSEETAKAVVPLVRRQIQQEQTIAQLVEMQELAEIDRSWRSSLAGLEKEFGALPAEVTHDDVMQFAADNDIASPVDAFWRIAGPGRSYVESLAEQRQAALNKAKAESATTRPAGSNAPDEAPLESKTTKGATKEAAKRILAELGLGD